MIQKVKEMVWVLVMNITILLTAIFYLVSEIQFLQNIKKYLFYTGVYTFILEGNKLPSKRLLTKLSSESLVSRMWGRSILFL